MCAQGRVSGSEWRERQCVRGSVSGSEWRGNLALTHYLPLNSLPLTFPLTHSPPPLTLALTHCLLLHPLPLTFPLTHSPPPLTPSEWRVRVCTREGEREWVEEETVHEREGECQ